jgi:hypothetical protein
MITEDSLDCPDVDLMEIGNVTAFTGNLLIAAEGNYILHMELILEGTEFEAWLGADDQVLDEGHVEIVFDMNDVNQSFIIHPPEEALSSEALPEDLPIPYGAKELSNNSGIVTYTIAQTSAEISEYYKAQMPGTGWTEVSVEEISGGFRLRFSKDSRTANITIEGDAELGPTSALIVVYKLES